MTFDFNVDINAHGGERSFAPVSVAEKYMRIIPAIKGLDWTSTFKTEDGEEHVVGDVAIDLNTPEGPKQLKALLSSYRVPEKPLILILTPPAYETGGAVDEARFMTAGMRTDRITPIITNGMTNLYTTKPCRHAVILDELDVRTNHQTGVLEIRFPYSLSSAPIELARNYEASLRTHCATSETSEQPDGVDRYDEMARDFF